VNGLYLGVFKAAKSISVFYIKLDITHGECDWPEDRHRVSVSSWPVSSPGTRLLHGLSRSKVPKVPQSLLNRETFSGFNVEFQ